MDDLDLRLVSALKADARRPMLSLSKEFKVSDATIHKRVHGLEEAGVIKGYTAILDPELLGYKITAFIELHIKPGTAGEIGEKLAKLPNVLEVFELHSHADILLKVQVKDLHELRDELVNRISAIPDITAKETHVVLNVTKSVNGPPV